MNIDLTFITQHKKNICCLAHQICNYKPVYFQCVEGVIARAQLYQLVIRMVQPCAMPAPVICKLSSHSPDLNASSHYFLNHVLKKQKATKICSINYKVSYNIEQTNNITPIQCLRHVGELWFPLTLSFSKWF